MQSLRKRTLSALGWSGASQLTGQTLQFAVSVALARVLSPSEFGLLGMVLVLSGFASSVADMGLGAAIIQRNALSERQLDSVFWLNVAIGATLTIVFSSAAPLVASFYNEPQLRLVTVAIAFNFLLASLNVVQTALLEKSLNFRARFRIETIAISTSGATALLLSLNGAGVWSLVGQSVGLTATRTAVLWWRSTWRPALSFDFAAVKEFLGFGWNVVGFNAVIYWAQNFDKLIIGRWIGGPALGIYTLADRLMRLPLTNVTNITGSVMVPALSALQNDVAAMRRAYLRANRLIALLTFPMMMGLGVLAEPAVSVVYGEKWRGAIEILQLLCFAGMAQSVYNTASWIFLSCGRPDILFRLGIFTTLVRVAGVLIGLQWGLRGVAWAYVLGGYLFVLYPTWSKAGGLINVRFALLLKNTAGPFCCATAMAAAIWFLDRGMPSQGAPWLRVAVGVFTGSLVYALLIRSFQADTWNDLKDITVRRKARKIG